MGIELDEYLYEKTVKYFKYRKKNNTAVLNRQINLIDIKQRLTLLARALTGKAIEIFPAEREGGYKNKNFFLPINCSLFAEKEDNLHFYFFRVAYLATQRNLGLNWHEKSATDIFSSEKAIETAPEVLRVLFTNYPLLQLWYESIFSKLPINSITKLADVSWLYGKWMLNSLENDQKEALHNVDIRSKTSTNVEAKTTLVAKAVEEIHSLIIDKKQQEDYVLMHSFEKIETAEEFNGNWRDFDGKDELKSHQEALEEMKMKFTVRVDDTVHSVYQADFVENTSVAESDQVENNEFHFLYNEWNYKKRAYLTDYCKVFPKKQIKSHDTYYHNTIQKYKTTLMGLRKMLTSVNNKMQLQRRQLQGEEFDLDALTDLYADLHSKKTPDERIYLSSRKKKKDIALLVLLDLSLSSDGYAAGNRVIDVEKEVSILFGEILQEFEISFAIDGFYSKTRNNTTYLTIKDFDDKWNQAKNKIGAVQPNGYTRIGPALRHAATRINKVEAQNKWIILLSDGKPNDYDKYEGTYGIQDIKQALREFNEYNINTYALAIENQAKYYLPQMFGHNHYQILTSPHALLKSLVKLYEKIKHQ